VIASFWMHLPLIRPRGIRRCVKVGMKSERQAWIQRSAPQSQRCAATSAISPYRISRTARAPGVFAKISSMPVRSALASSWRVPSPNELLPPEEFGMQTTGVCEPAVRMRLVSRSLCSVENGAAQQHQIEIADLELLDRVSDRTCRYNDISSGSQIRTLRGQSAMNRGQLRGRR